MKTMLLAAAIASLGAAAVAEPVKYELDPGHSQVVFTYNHLGFSTGTGMFSGFEGEIMFDQADPANSSVNVSMPTASLITGFDARKEHFLSKDFFNAADNEAITFKSTKIDVTGDKTAKIAGDLTINGTTKPVVLDATLNQAGENPTAKKQWAGFEATTEIKRSDFGMGKFAPYVSDEVKLHISIEAGVAG